MSTLKIGALAAAACLGLMASGGVAQADPVGNPEAQVFPLMCPDETVNVVVAGHGAFTPAHDLDSNRVFIPTSFGAFTVVVTTPDGTVIDSFTDPAVSKGSADKARRTSLTCTYGFEEDIVDPDLGPLHIEGSGTVTGFVTPARG